MKSQLMSRGIALPTGRMITSNEGDGQLQPIWLSDTPTTAELWARIQAEHASTGVWPLLLESDERDDAFRPWGSGELFPERMTSPDEHNPGELLEQWWQSHTVIDADDVLSPEERLEVTAPFQQAWPGMAPVPGPGAEPAAMAAGYAEHLLGRMPSCRLGLVCAATGADSLTQAGWDGPANYDNDTAKFSAVVRSWEARFGARVVAVGGATLYLSVAIPPTTLDEALSIAAEHFAFCPDNVWQGHHETLREYAESLVGLNSWEFWWD